MASKIMKVVLLLLISILGSSVCSSNRIYLTKSGWAPSPHRRKSRRVAGNASVPEKIGIDWAKDQGLEVNAALSSGLFVYELKIPFLASETRPWAIGAQPGAQIGIGIESAAVYQTRPREEVSGGTGGGGATEGSGDMGGRAGRGGRGRGEFNTRPHLAKSLKCWLVIQLAQEKTISQPALLSVMY